MQSASLVQSGPPANLPIGLPCPFRQNNLRFATQHPTDYLGVFCLAPLAGAAGQHSVSHP
jgi:hypothetical protein